MLLELKAVMYIWTAVFYHISTRAHAEMYLMAACATSNSHVRHKGRDYEDSGPVATQIS